MKKRYEMPEVKTAYFEAEDVICTSAPETDVEWNNAWGDASENA